ncbi:MAG: helix-turn-helix transcriptional regulator [Isosphaeraceae bacterium]
MKTKERAFTQKLKDKLLTEMARLGLNGQKLSTRSKVSDSEISRILSGQSTPGLENAFRLARAVNVSLDYLADDALENDPMRATDPLSPEERRVLEVVQRLGLTRALLLLENISFIGYETAMQRLLSARPVIEIDPDEHRSGAASPVSSGVVTPRSNTA